MTHSGADIRALLDRHGLEARRSLGQNFVVDPNTVRRIAALAEVGPGDPIVEIGPGLGSLTLALLEHDASVTAIEMDTELVPILREVVAGRDVSIVEGDAQQVDWGVVLASHPAWKLVANLPYNVATPLILDLLRDVPAITEMLVMVQLEVAERLAATPRPGNRDPVGTRRLPRKSRGGWTGPTDGLSSQPRVDSALVRIVRHEHPPVDTSLDRLEPLVRAAYNQRRKMIRKSLSGLRTVEQIEAAGVDPQARPETLDLAAWGRLADA